MAHINFSVTQTIVDTTPLFDEWGTVGRWTGRVTREIKAGAIARAPVNKSFNKSDWGMLGHYPRGALKASIRGESRRAGGHARHIEIRATVPYAIFVHEGTTGPIYPRRGKFLKLPEYHPGGVVADTTFRPQNEGRRSVFGTTPYSRLRKSVSGQASQPFILRAYNATAYRRRELPTIAASI